MMIAACKQCLPSGRAERGGVEAIVLEPARGEPLKIGRLTRPSKGAGCAEANIVEKDDEYVRRSFGRTQRLDGRKPVSGSFAS